MNKTKREAYKWINMKLNIILDFNNPEEHRLFNIQEMQKIL
jgi:hypothetical protein